MLSRILDVQWQDGDVQDDDVAIEAALAEFNAGLSRVAGTDKRVSFPLPSERRFTSFPFNGIE